MKGISLLCLLFFMSTQLQAQVNNGESGTISGLVYSDFYWAASHHTESVEGSNGFWFRRIYLTYDHRYNNSFSGRLRFEMNSEGDFETSANMTPFVKDAYLKWENERHAIYAGISTTPAFAMVERVWGYRSVEKTPVDLQRLASSRDFGIAARGSFGSNGRLNYHAMIGNGNSTRNETDTGKKMMMALSYQTAGGWILEAYGDVNHFSNNQRWMTVHGFAGYLADNFSLGALYAHQLRETTAPGTGSMELRIASVFTRATVTSKFTGFFRIDRMFDPNPEGENIDYLPFHDEAESILLIGGLDVELEENIHLIPNVEAVIYGETPGGITPRTDIIPRMTLAFSF